MLIHIQVSDFNADGNEFLRCYPEPTVAEWRAMSRKCSNQKKIASQGILSWRGLVQSLWVEETSSIGVKSSYYMFRKVPWHPLQHCSVHTEKHTQGAFSLALIGHNVHEAKDSQQHLTHCCTAHTENSIFYREANQIFDILEANSKCLCTIFTQIIQKFKFRSVAHCCY